MNPDLFTAILALDAYNRGYGAGVSELAANGKIGNATISSDSESAFGQSGQAAGFYAVAYDWNGKIVISYRGTDQYTRDAATGAGSDIFSGWAIGAGFDAASQAGLAKAFYESVVHLSPYTPQNGSVLLTGHSLGGSLAGFVGSLAAKPVWAR